MTQPDTVAAARLLLAQLGISPEELVVAANGQRPDAPTVVGGQVLMSSRVHPDM